jgi:23S rRNA pseudouridine2605 synthase
MIDVALNRPPGTMSLIRLSKILSQSGVASRRHAERFIREGRVWLNGKLVEQMGVKADPAVDDIRVDGRRLSPPKVHQYYAYYKPRGVVVTKSDELGRRGIFNLLKLPPAVNAVGRLDKDSEGLLLLSDDGNFLQEFTHPSFQVPKVYHAQISRALKASEKKQLTEGMKFPEKKVRVQWVQTLKRSGGIWVALELREGVKREIRRMLEALGIDVLRLIRVQQGSVKLGKMKPGDLRPLKFRPMA